jgi:hypothetical protein
MSLTRTEHTLVQYNDPVARKPGHRSSRTRTVKQSSVGRRSKPSSLEDDRDSLETRIVLFATRGKLRPAADTAVKAQLAAGLPVVYRAGNRIVLERPDGTQETLRTVTDSFQRVPDQFRSRLVAKSGKRRK